MSQVTYFTEIIKGKQIATACSREAFVKSFKNRIDTEFKYSN